MKTRRKRMWFTRKKKYSTQTRQTETSHLPSYMWKLCKSIFQEGSSQITSISPPRNTLHHTRLAGSRRAQRFNYVTETCKVPISIGRFYQDEVKCDVIEMDASHMLLGRPWQHDVDTLHNGKGNTISFKWNTHHVYHHASRRKP